MADEKAGRPVPRPSVYVDTQPFWDGLSRGKPVSVSVSMSPPCSTA